MPIDISHKLIIAISSRALFDLDESNAIYEKEGVEKYAQYQIAHESDILKPGPAFPLVQKLLHLNKRGDFVEIVLLSKNSADTGLRIFNSIAHYQLNITRAAFTSGESTFNYAQAFHSHLFLSTNTNDVKNALCSGCAAAEIFSSTVKENSTNELRIAFDGDAVLFSNDSEKIFQNEGIDAFTKHEVTGAKNPLPGGPFKGFLKALQHLQQQFPVDECPVRTALVTARQAPTHERVILTLRAWGIRIDEALFLGGLSKGEFLKAFQADIFFDDQPIHCESAAKHVTTAHVPNNPN
ncbi:MAG: 5'-nucleotidase [Gammaproteobacteria bacterium RIFCSPHIGHO2_12_FULL_38_11]|nr:MAG: 5'-nucleotidase [Gammaproteobacteria bacterium RIFCSPHIGHO2_12_FULL_38_11]